MSFKAFGLGFHHLGLAVRKPDSATDFLYRLGYRIGKVVLDVEQNVNLVRCAHSVMPSIELVYPTDTSGPVSELLERAGESVYHTCYETSDVKASVDAIETAGHRVVCVRTAKPAILFGGREVSFYYVGGFGLIELLSSERGPMSGGTDVA